MRKCDDLQLTVKGSRQAPGNNTNEEVDSQNCRRQEDVKQYLSNCLAICLENNID